MHVQFWLVEGTHLESLMPNFALIGTIHCSVQRPSTGSPALILHTLVLVRYPRSTAALRSLTSSQITAAFGEYNQLVQEVAGLRGQTLANWDFDSRDAAGATGDQSLRSYNSLIASRPSSILTLNHEITRSTPQILPEVIRDLQAAGYRLTTLADCLGEPAYQWVDEPQERTVSLGLPRVIYRYD